MYEQTEQSTVQCLKQFIFILLPAWYIISYVCSLMQYDSLLGQMWLKFCFRDESLQFGRQTLNDLWRMNAFYGCLLISESVNFYLNYCSWMALPGVCLSRVSMNSGYLVSLCIACGMRSFNPSLRHNGLLWASCNQVTNRTTTVYVI